MRAVNIDIDKAKKLYGSGMSTDCVASELRIGGSTLRRLFQNIGYKIRKPGNSGNRKRRSSLLMGGNYDVQMRTDDEGLRVCAKAQGRNHRTLLGLP